MVFLRINKCFLMEVSKLETNEKRDWHRMMSVPFIIIGIGSNGSEELDQGVAIGLWQLIELQRGSIAIALLGVAVPEDGLDLIAGATVVQAVFSARVDERQAATPQRRGATP